MKDDAERLPVPGPHATDAMSQADSVRATRSLYGSIVDRKHDRIALP